MTFHIIIRQERRTPTVTEFGVDSSRLATEIGTSIPTGNTIQGPMGDMPEYVAGPEQLHTMSDAGVPANIADAQFVGVFEWDGRAPYVIAHKGDYAAVTMRYAGWPDITKEQYDALPAADTLA